MTPPAAAQKNTTRVIGTKKAGRPRTREIKKSVPPPPAPPAPEPAISHSDVRQRALLVNLTVHQWLANTTDEQITEDVRQQHGIAADMGKYQKNLLSKAALGKLRSAGNRLRAIHNRFTLPWDEWGTRILHSAKYMEYNTAIRQAIDEFDQIFRDELEAIDPASGLTKYEAAKAEAKRLLNGAYREKDYPTPEQLRSKFRAKITVMPIPAGEDFRIDLGAQATSQVRAEIEARANERITEAMKGVYEQIQERVVKLASALNAEKTDAIRKTLFTSIETFIEALPGFNITADPVLDRLGSDIKAMVAGLNAAELRENQILRAAVAVKAEAILAKMVDFLG